MVDRHLLRWDRRRGREQFVHIGLCLCDGQPLFDHVFCRRQPLILRQAEQRAGVALAEGTLLDHLQHLRRELQQAQLVGHGGLAFAHLAGGLLLTQPVLDDEPPQSHRLLGLGVTGSHHNAGHRGQTGHPRRPEPPLPGDELIAPPHLPDGQGL